jgi:hypothetical protein
MKQATHAGQTRNGIPFLQAKTLFRQEEIVWDLFPHFVMPAATGSAAKAIQQEFGLCSFEECPPRQRRLASRSAPFHDALIGKLQTKNNIALSIQLLGDQATCVKRLGPHGSEIAISSPPARKAARHRPLFAAAPVLTLLAVPVKPGTPIGPATSSVPTTTFSVLTIQRISISRPPGPLLCTWGREASHQLLVQRRA